MEKNLEKKTTKKQGKKTVQRKGNYVKGARREETIEFLEDKNLTLVPEYFKNAAFFLTLFKGYKCNKFM